MTEVALALKTPLGRAKCIAEMSSYELTIWKVRSQLAPLNCNAEELARHLSETAKDGIGPLEREQQKATGESAPTAKQVAEMFGWGVKPLSELDNGG